MGPIILTSEGLSNPYFKGTAMNTSVSNEIPSRIAIILKRPTFVFNRFIIIILNKVCWQRVKMAMV